MRKSPELRIYRSLPSRRQEYREIVDKNEIVKPVDREAPNCDQKEPIGQEASKQVEDRNGSAKDDSCRDVARNEVFPYEKSAPRGDINERTNPKRHEKLFKQEEEVPSSDAIKAKKTERSTVTTNNKTKAEEQEETNTANSQEQSTPRISLIKPPRILSKFISPDTKSNQTKHGERKSSIPIFKRSSKEFEDIRSPQESPKRSLIPQRYLFKCEF